MSASISFRLILSNRHHNHHNHFGLVWRNEGDKLLVCYSSSNHELGFCNKQTFSSKWWSWCSSSRYLLACLLFKNEDALFNHKHKSELLYLFPLLIVSSFNLFKWKDLIFVFLHAFGVYICKSECLYQVEQLYAVQRIQKKKNSIIPYTIHNHSIPLFIPFMRNWKEYNLFCVS